MQVSFAKLQLAAFCDRSSILTSLERKSLRSAIWRSNGRSEIWLHRRTQVLRPPFAPQPPVCSPRTRTCARGPASLLRQHMPVYLLPTLLILTSALLLLPLPPLSDQYENSCRGEGLRTLGSGVSAYSDCRVLRLEYFGLM